MSLSTQYSKTYFRHLEATRCCESIFDFVLNVTLFHCTHARFVSMTGSFHMQNKVQSVGSFFICDIYCFFIHNIIFGMYVIGNTH